MKSKQDFPRHPQPRTPASPLRRQLLAASALGVASGRLFAQEFPSRPIVLTVPFAAGGTADVTARRLAEVLAKVLNVSVVVDNKPSAGAFVATSHVARATKDGHTLLFSTNNALALNPFIYRNLPYKPQDLTPVSLVSRQAFALNASVHAPFSTLTEFVRWAKSQSNGVQMGTTGIGTTTHILGEWIAQEVGFKLDIVPYKGVSQSTIDLIAGRIPIQMDGIASAAKLHRAGKSRVIAAMGEARAGLPDGVPNFRDGGYPELVAYADFGVLAPTGTPDAIVQRLHRAVAAAVNQPDFRDGLAANGETAVASASPVDYGERIARERARWERIVKPMNLQLD